MTSNPRLLIVIPCLNEAAHLPALLAWLSADPLTDQSLIVIADGGSDDASPAIVEQFARENPRIRLLRNEKRIQSAGLNRAVEQFGADASFILRIDAHAAYPKGYIARLLEAQHDSGAQSVTVTMHATAHSGRCFQIAAATAQNSVLGTGGSAHRAQGERRFVDHGHHALFQREWYTRIGGYDETFSHNEDAEFDHRLSKAGGRILLAGDIVIDYFPRTTARALWRQYFKFGAGRAATALKHKTRLKPRQLAPLIIAPAALAVILAPLWPLTAAPFGAYLALCSIAGVVVGAGQGSLCALASGVPAAIMHLAWSVGYWRRWLFSARRA